MTESYTLVRYQHGREKFEIMVDPDNGLKFKNKELIDISKVLLIDTIFTDANKGEKASTTKLGEIFKTSDPYAVAEQIFEKGTFLLTAQQRNEMLEQKRKRIVNIISRSYIDPSNKLPHPPLRIENAMEQANVNIDPLKLAEDQVHDIVKQLRSILPMSSDNVEIALKIPPEYTGKSYSIVKDHATIKREEWQSDGSWVSIIEVPAAMYGELLERLGKVTQGNMQSKIIN